jgi:hypothetical protein
VRDPETPPAKLTVRKFRISGVDVVYMMVLKVIKS